MTRDGSRRGAEIDNIFAETPEGATEGQGAPGWGDLSALRNRLRRRRAGAEAETAPVAETPPVAPEVEPPTQPAAEAPTPEAATAPASGAPPAPDAADRPAQVDAPPSTDPAPAADAAPRPDAPAPGPRPAVLRASLAGPDDAPARPRSRLAREAARRAEAEAAAARAHGAPDPAPAPGAPDPAPAPGAPDPAPASGATDAPPETPAAPASELVAAPRQTARPAADPTTAPPRRRWAPLEVAETAPADGAAEPSAHPIPESVLDPALAPPPTRPRTPLGAIQPALRVAPADEAVPATRLAEPGADAPAPPRAPETPAPATQAAPPPAPPGGAAGPAVATPGGDEPPPDGRFTARGGMLLGFGGVAVLLLGLFGWGANVDIAGAIIAPGQVEVETRDQVVEHPDGGVVGAIFARDGDRVAAGDVLLRFDDTLLRSEETILYDQYWELVSRRNRLEAEQFRAEDITWDPAVLAQAEEDPDVAKMVRGQQQLFETRNRSEAEQVEQLRERQAQIREQITGAEAQMRALDRQLELIEQELVGQRQLLEQGLTQLNRVLSLEREAARLEGQVGQLTSTVAEGRGRIAEIEIQILQASTQRQEQAITQVRDIQYQENQVREQLVQVREQLDRMEVRAPISGTVFDSTVFAERSVVQPGEPILFVVPSDVEFVITAQVEPIHIDQVFVGQPATLRFSAFSMRNTPEIDGEVVKVSADAKTDEQRGISYYTAEVALKQGEAAKLEGLTLVPGMPVEAYIKTDDRTPLSYLVKPLADYFSRSLREE